MRHLQQYQIFKFTSSRLKRNNYCITQSIEEGRRNGEIVSIGDSQMLRSLRTLKNQTNQESNIHDLVARRKFLKSKLSTPENINSLLETELALNKLLFVPEIIAVTFDKNNHYEHIGKNGFLVNDTKFVRLLCSAGNARKNTAMFIAEEYELPLKEILNNNRNDIDIIPSKFNAYFSLASSSSIPVSTPYFTVLADKEVVRKEVVEYVTENSTGDDDIRTEEKDITFNLWDGMGLISPRQAQVWAKELDLDYVPSTFIIRSNFIKGMVCVFDFHKFSDECGVHNISDIWGNSYNTRDADVILTGSQFKLWNAYNNQKHYTDSCRKNDITWNVARWSPKEEKTYTNLNYQFLQVLDLDKDAIRRICQKTIDYLRNIVTNDKNYALLYLLGDIINREFDPGVYSKISDVVTKAIILNNDLIDDPYVRGHLIHSLNKKIKESYIGNILVDGFYTTMIADPYAFCEYMFGFPVKGLLERNQHYNKTWLDRGSVTLASMRAPLTWRSEINIVHLQNNSLIQEWYQHIRTGLIFNIHGVDCMLEADSDFDGDLTCLTNQPEIIKFATKGFPINYTTKKAPKKKIDEAELYKHDLKGFNTKVGFLTNLSTAMYAMLPNFSFGSQENNVLINRLKQCRKEQGAIIDSTKGLEIRPIPNHWSNWLSLKEVTDEEEIRKIKFNNTIMVDKRPYFFRYLYPNYNQHYNNYNNFYQNYCITNFGKNLVDCHLNPESGKEREIMAKYDRFIPLLDTDCTMNNICHYLETEIKEFKNCSSKASDYIIGLLKNKDIEVDKDKLKAMYEIYKRYKAEKRNFNTLKGSNGEEMYKTLEQYNKAVRQDAFKISSDIQELANLAIVLCYELYPSDSKTFVWNVFGEGVIKNIEQNRQSVLEIPWKCENGQIEFLGNRYCTKEIDLYGEGEKEEPDDDYNF